MNPGLLQLWHWQSDVLTSRLGLVFYKLSLNEEAGDCLLGSGNIGKVQYASGLEKFKEKQPNLLTMTLGYRSIVSLDAATSRLEEGIFQPVNFLWKKLKGS